MDVVIEASDEESTELINIKMETVCTNSEETTRHKVIKRKKRRSTTVVPWKDDNIRRWVYFVIDTTTRKVVYVGQTMNLRGRWNAHQLSTSQCAKLKKYIHSTVHKPEFTVCEKFPDGVTGKKHADILEAYMIAFYNTVYNRFTNEAGCNLTAGNHAADCDYEAQVKKWEQEGYKHPQIADGPSYYETDFDEAVLRDWVDIAESATEASTEVGTGVKNALKDSLALVVSARSRHEALNIEDVLRSMRKRANARGNVWISRKEYCQDYSGPLRELIAELITTNLTNSGANTDAIEDKLHRVEALRRVVRQSHLLVGDHAPLRVVSLLIDIFLCTLGSNATSERSKRANVLSALRAHCRPGWSHSRTVEEAILKTTRTRDNPPAEIGDYTPDEIEWFNDRIMDMHNVQWVKNSKIETGVHDP
jgi:hypothetical protein